MNKRIILASVVLFFSASVVAQVTDGSLIPYRQGNKWGFANPDKQVIISPVYDDAGWFNGGYAPVKKGNKYGYINRQGKVVIPFKFYNAKPFQYGFMENAKTHKEDTVLFAGATLQPGSDAFEICIDTKGARMSKCPAIPESAMPGNAKPAENIKEKVYTVAANIDLYDKIVDDYKLSSGEDNYYIAVKNGKYGVFNNKFEVIVPFAYNSLTPVTLGGNTYLVAGNGMKGVINGNGSTLIPVDNNNINYVNGPNGMAYFIFSKDGKSGVRDISNTEVIPSMYNNIGWDEGGFVLTGTDNMQGFYFPNRYMVQPKYSNVKLVRGGRYLLVTTASGKKGYVSDAGMEYFSE